MRSLSTEINSAGIICFARRCFEFSLFFLALLAFMNLSVGELFAQNTIIDGSWLSSRIPPYRLTGTGSTYTLATDVVTDASAFVFADNGITLDLGGHTITYGNLSFDGLYNGGFEISSASSQAVPAGWDLTGAPHAKRQTHLDKLFYDDYSLRMENPAGDGINEEYVRSSEIYLPTAGNYAAIAQVQGGPYSAVKVNLTIEGISVTPSNHISSMPTVYQGTDMSIGIISEFSVSAPCTIRVRVVLSTNDPSVSTSANIDEVDVRPIGMYGISQEGYNKSMAEIRNGIIRQGASQAIYSHALFGTSANSIHNLTIITNGINSENISETWASGMRIFNNLLEAHGKLPLHRHYPFSMINLSRTSGGNEIYGNTLLYGPHVGIYHGNSSSSRDNDSRSLIHNNTIRLRVVATNGFSVVIGSNADIYSNTIQPFQGHGIGLSSGSNNVRIYDNVINPITWPCSEYSAYNYPNSAHGIRIKTYGSGNLHDVEIFNNRIAGSTLPQKSNCYTEVSGITNYTTDSDPAADPNFANLSIHDNEVQVSTDNAQQQHAIAYKQGQGGSVLRNTFRSNHVIIEMSDADAGAGINARLESNVLEKAGDSGVFCTLRFGYNRPYNNHFVDSSTIGGSDLANVCHSRTYSPATDMAVSWFLAVTVMNQQNMPIAGASISVRDKSGNIAATAVTNPDGKAKLELKQYTYYYDTKARFEYYSPFQVSASASGYPQAVRTLDINKSTSTTLIMGNAKQPPPAPHNLRIQN